MSTRVSLSPDGDNDKCAIEFGLMQPPMSKTAPQRSVRGISPSLLVIAALCFLLPFVGVSCNAGATRAALGNALSQIGGAAGPAVIQCEQSLSSDDLVSVTGVDLLTGSSPSVLSNLPGCQTTFPSQSGLIPGFGVHALLMIALILILAGILAVLLRARWRSPVAGGAALIAAALIVINNLSVQSSILDSIQQASAALPPAAESTPDMGSVLNVHAAVGFWLAVGALILTIGVNAAALLLARRPAPMWASIHG
jgi:hypothetical protein